MFAFLLRFLDEYPTIYLIICCLAMLIWVYFFNVETNAEQNRLDIYGKQQKIQSQNIPIVLNTIKDIRWIKAFKRFPTNIETHFAEKFFTSTPLTWMGFSNWPQRMLFQNTGFDARMTAIYEAGNVPFVSGNAVGAKYLFSAIRFLCHSKIATQLQSSSNNIEHIVNGRAFDMEMQLLAENEDKTMPNRFLIFSWFFTKNKSKNYSLEPLLKCLKYIRRPNTLKTINKPFPLDRIVYESTGGFYGYIQRDDNTGHSIHHQFIEANHLIPIGITQLSEFHKLAHHSECSMNGRVRIENHSSNTIKLTEYLNGESNRRIYTYKQC